MLSEMDRLHFLLPDFTRTSWVSEHARITWEPRLKAISRFWNRMETESIRRGVRHAALMTTKPERLARRTAELEKSGLAVKVVAKTRAGLSYSSTAEAPRPGEAVSLRIAVGRPEVVERVARAYGEGDVETIGKELGYPACCRDFFRTTWVEQKYRDTIWQMSVATADVRVVDEFSVECKVQPYTNVLWRWFGARAVPHLPCRFDCEHSLRFAQQFLEAGRDLGFERERDDLLSLLSWPVEWSALHGIAEIKTPILKVVNRTDSTARRYRVRLLGSSYPTEGATGLNFPFVSP